MGVCETRTIECGRVLGSLVRSDEGRSEERGKENVTPVAHAPPAMVLFSFFCSFTFAFVLTAVAVPFKPGCAVSAADTSSV